jgi:hypothetical protein
VPDNVAVRNGEGAAAVLIAAISRPERLWTQAEVLVRPSPVPPVARVYGWHFIAALGPGLDPDRLLYVGIAPRQMSNRTSGQHLRKQIRYHCRGNAYGSTMRLTLGCLLGLPLRQVGSGTRLTFGAVGEARLSEWMHEYARVCRSPTSQPWLVESSTIECLDLPLNLDRNRGHPFHATLTRLRAEARIHAREQPIVS